MLALEWDLPRDHPKIDKLRGDGFTTFTRSLGLCEPGSSHLGIDVLIDSLDVLPRQMVPDRVGDVRGQTHGFDVPKRLVESFVLIAKEGFLEVRLPF